MLVKMPEKPKGKFNAELQQDSRVILSGFKELDDSEITRIKAIIANYVLHFKKVSNFKNLKLHLKSVHNKNSKLHLHFIDAELVKAHDKHKGILGAKAQHRNPYTAISEALDKLLSEIQHNSHKEEWKEERHKEARKKKT